MQTAALIKDKWEYESLQFKEIRLVLLDRTTSKTFLGPLQDLLFPSKPYNGMTFMLY